MYRVLIAEDHSVTSWGLAFLLSGLPDFEVVDHVADGLSLANALARGDADLLMLDLALPGRSGLDILEHDRPKIPVLVISGQGSARDFERARSAGAAGLISKSDSPDQIIAALKALTRGEKYCSPGIRALLGESPEPDSCG